MHQRLNVHQFTDYRTFLTAYVQGNKQAKPQWSYGAWAQNLGLKTTSSITKIIQGQREPGPAITEKLIKYFGFNQKQAQYFRDLVRLEKIKNDPRLSVLLMQKMGKDHPDASLRIMDDKVFLTISNWYILALRELCRAGHFKEDPEWIAQQFHFKVTSREIRQAIEALIELQLLQRDRQGRLKIIDGRIDTTTDVASEAIKLYHEQMLTHAKEAIRKFGVKEREFTATSLLMSSKNIEKAKTLIRDFRHNFEKLMEEDSGDQIYQIQIQLFPLTKKESSK
jgi:uncharacterized protein (TIGR02147 family)